MGMMIFTSDPIVEEKAHHSINVWMFVCEWMFVIDMCMLGPCVCVCVDHLRDTCRKNSKHACVCVGAYDDLNNVVDFFYLNVIYD